MKSETFRSLGDRVLLKPDVAEDKQYGSTKLIVPAAVQEKPLTGTVVTIGPDVKDASLAEGATVIYSKYGGMDVQFDDGLFLLLREQDVLGVCG